MPEDMTKEQQILYEKLLFLYEYSNILEENLMYKPDNQLSIANAIINIIMSDESLKKCCEYKMLLKFIQSNSEVDNKFGYDNFSLFSNIVTYIQKIYNDQNEKQRIINFLYSYKEFILSKTKDNYQLQKVVIV